MIRSSWSWLAACGLVCTLAACSKDDDASPSGAAGEGGAGASASGGTPSSGGISSGGTSTSGAAGTPAAAGAPTGSAGAPGAAGNGPANDACPELAPEAGQACEAPLASCSYAGADCICLATEWSCTNAEDCPAQRPAESDDCGADNTQGDTCIYADVTCFCRADETWNCIDLTPPTEPDCPQAQPDDGADCTGLNGIACFFGTTPCACRNDAWSCADIGRP